MEDNLHYEFAYFRDRKFKSEQPQNAQPQEPYRIPEMHPVPPPPSTIVYHFPIHPCVVNNYDHYMHMLERQSAIMRASIDPNAWDPTDFYNRVDRARRRGFNS